MPPTKASGAIQSKPGKKSPACIEAVDAANHNFGKDSEQAPGKKIPACPEDMDTTAFAMKRSHEIIPFPQVL